VHGKTLGIVGFGAIGQAVARRARGFGMTVIYHGPHRKPEAENETGGSYRPTLAALLGEADIVSLNCALTADTRHLLDADTLSMTKPGAVVINTGRGPLIHEAALVETLASGHLGGAGLDVFEFEPKVTAALMDFDNVTLLPHIGSATAECRADMAGRLLGNIQAFLATGKPLDACW
jgi:glyoxylate reductase